MSAFKLVIVLHPSSHLFLSGPLRPDSHGVETALADNINYCIQLMSGDIAINTWWVYITSFLEAVSTGYIERKIFGFHKKDKFFSHLKTIFFHFMRSCWRILSQTPQLKAILLLIRGYFLLIFNTLKEHFFRRTAWDPLLGTTMHQCIMRQFSAKATKKNWA